MRGSRSRAGVFASGAMLAAVIVTSSSATAAPDEPLPPIAGAQPDEPIDLGDDFVVYMNGEPVSRTSRALAAPVTGPGYILADNAPDPPLQDHITYTVRLVTNEQGDIEVLRADIVSAAAQISATSGTLVRVAAGSVPDGVGEDLLPVDGEILVSIDDSTPCGPGVIGCGSFNASWFEGDPVATIDRGRVWVAPGIESRPATQRASIVAHEMGHTIGLAHFDEQYDGSYQVMRSVLSPESPATYRSGDLNGIRAIGYPVPHDFTDNGTTAILGGGPSYRLFAADGDGAVWQGWVTAGTDWKWQSLGGNLRGALGAVYTAPGRYEVFGVSAGGTLYQRTYNGSWGPWRRQSVSGLKPGVTALRAPDGVYRVFGVDVSGQLVQAYYSGGRWNRQLLGGNIVGAPGVVYRNGRFDIFATSPGGTLYQKSYVGGWSGWSRVGGLNLVPGASAVYSGKYHVYVTTTGGTVYQAHYSGGWKWQSLGGGVRGKPGAIYFQGFFDVFAPAANGRQYFTYYDSGWQGWHLLW